MVIEIKQKDDPLHINTYHINTKNILYLVESISFGNKIYDVYQINLVNDEVIQVSKEEFERVKEALKNERKN